MTCSFTTENSSWELYKSNLYTDMYINLVNYNVRCQYQFVVLKTWQRRHYMKVVASDYYIFSYVFALLVLAKNYLIKHGCIMHLFSSLYCSTARLLQRILRPASYMVLSRFLPCEPQVFCVCLFCVAVDLSCCFDLSLLFYAVKNHYLNSVTSYIISHVTSELSLGSRYLFISVGVKCVTYRNSGTKRCSGPSFRQLRMLVSK